MKFVDDDDDDDDDVNIISPYPAVTGVLASGVCYP